MMEPLPYPCMPHYTFNSVPKWTQLDIMKSGNFSIYMYTCISHTLFTIDHANISYSATIWWAIYLVKCPNLAFGELYIRHKAMGDGGFAAGTDGSCGWSSAKECRSRVRARSLVLFLLSPFSWAVFAEVFTTFPPHKEPRQSFHPSTLSIINLSILILSSATYSHLITKRSMSSTSPFPHSLYTLSSLLTLWCTYVHWYWYSMVCTLLKDMFTCHGLCSHVVMQLALLKRKETRGVKVFPTKTSRDVGMMDGVSDATGSSMKKQTGRKSPGTRRCSVTV